MRRFLSTEFAVGTFALLGLLIIIYMSMKVNDRSVVSGSTNQYRAYFESVSGLVRKVPVEVSGITAGLVDSIELENSRALVIITVTKNVKVYANSSLTVRDRGILGDKYLQLNPGTPDHPLLGDGGEIPNTYSKGDFDRLVSSVSETADSVQELMKSDSPKGALGATILNLKDLTGKIRDMVGTNEERINRSLANLEAFSADLKEITGENKEHIHAVLVAMEDVTASLKDALQKERLDRMASRLDNTLASLEKISGKIEHGEGTIGKLINDETTVNKLNDTLDGVNEAVGGFRKLQLSVRYRGEFLAGVEKLQNQIGLTIAPSPDKFIFLEIVDAPKGNTRVTDTSVTSGGNVVSSTQTIQTDDKFLFTLMLGKKFWDLSLRFGLIRSDGGVGMDYSLFDDKFVVSFEAFDFNRTGDRAHMRAYGTLVLYKHLLLTGGVDDMITKVSRHNPFFGAGLQFNDRDFKSLIGAGAASAMH